MNWFASFRAVFTGFLVNIIPAIVIDIVLHGIGVFPPTEQPIDNKQSLIAVSYRLVLAVLSGFVVAKMAPSSPMKHVLVLGGIGVVLSTMGAIAMWNMGPGWYPVSLIIASIPLSLAGGKLSGKF